MPEKTLPRLEYLTIPIDLIDPHPENPRTHPDEQIFGLEASYESLGQFRSFVVWKRPSGRFIQVTSHGITEAMRREGATHVRVEALDENTDPLIVKQIMLADNLHPLKALDDDEMLVRLLQEQQQAGYDLAALGTDDETLRQMLEAMGDGYGAGSEEGAGGDEFDTTPDEGPTRTHLGELWQLGEHRLLVGDCTRIADVQRVLQGEKVDMIFTDPPYGVNYTGGTKEWEALDNDHDASIYAKFVPLLPQIMHEKAALYTCFAARSAKQVYEAIECAGFEVRALLIWNKNHAQFGAMGAHYKQKHEPILYCARQGGSLNWYGPNNEVTVWDIARAAANEYHSTQKPLELVQRALNNSSHKGDVVFDGFGGGGSTLIACHRIGRKARLIEIDPEYADVILRRYEAETGQTATLLERVEVAAHV